MFFILLLEKYDRSKRLSSKLGSTPGNSTASDADFWRCMTVNGINKTRIAPDLRNRRYQIIGVWVEGVESKLAIK